MASKRRKINGFLPIDKLAGDVANTTSSLDGGTERGQHDHGNRTVSKRYKEYRRTPKVVEQLKHISAEDFLPLANRSADLQPSDLENDSIQNSSDSARNGNQATTRHASAKNSIQEVKNDEFTKEDELEAIQGDSEDEGFESLEGTPPLKRTVKIGNGLLSSSPFDIWKNNSNLVVTKFNLSGVLNTIDVRKKIEEKSQCLLKFINDASGPRVTFTHRNFDIKNAQVDFRKDCESVIFDKDYSCIGMVFKEFRFIDMDNKLKIGRVQTKLMAWSNNTTVKSNKIHKIKNILSNINNFKLRVVDDKKSLIKTLDEIAIREYKNKVIMANNSTNEAFEKLRNKRHFWEKSEFQSLGVQNRLLIGKLSPSSSLSGQKIRIPTLSDSSEESSPRRPQQNTISGINPLNFYSKPTEKVDAGLGSTPSYSTLRKSPRTRSETPNLVQGTLWDLDNEKNLEVPETLDPALSHKFPDGASYMITNQDFKCLYNHDWINDSILDFFTKFYAEKSIQEDVISRGDIHLMSSFFYTKLVSDPSDYYGNVKKWVANSDLFRKKYIVVPINMNFHWFGCIITGLDLILEFFQNSDGKVDKTKLSNENRIENDNYREHDSEGPLRIKNALNSSDTNKKAVSLTEDEEVTLSTPIITILTFDSLRQTHTREIDPIKEFLIAYAKDKYEIKLDKALIKMKTCAVPQQPNMSDCGVHVILNNMKFFENPRKTIEVWRSTKTRSKSSGKVVNEYFERNRRDSARKFLREVVWDLHAEQLKIMKQNGNYPAKYANCFEKVGQSGDNEDDGDLEIIEDTEDYKKALAKAVIPETGRGNENLTKGSSELPDSPQKVNDVAASSLDEPKKISPAQARPTDERSTIRALEGEPVDTISSESYSLERPPIGNVSLESPRNFLESSPIRKGGRHTASDSTSPYFGDSSLKSRAETFDTESLSSTKVLIANDCLMDENQKDTKSGSPLLSDLNSLKRQEPDQDEDRVSATIDLLLSPCRQKKYILSGIERDDDVNLLGTLKSQSSLTRVKRDVGGEPNKSIDLRNAEESTAGLNRWKYSEQKPSKPYLAATESDRLSFVSGMADSKHDIQTIYSDDDMKEVR
ncbi:hypothetical protein HG535_0F03280 [Zygotorulaspora mrakii]|uniref:Ubiquitin-like protease family profile domain-containing protein n=1 Tax=Zygotorulaspora mrakii TaxID=42260 RepID=A0A7H9B5L5_ZYGMR|nr:uncharacterized protein HG535_0F03280 [Zygotorulaspora mrakii]QLG73817.1 hypothetical protein HG535_0F03280 [Zygotorulaspora mrakii]